MPYLLTVRRTPRNRTVSLSDSLDQNTPVALK
jgi:hypothetical protein